MITNRCIRKIKLDPKGFDFNSLSSDVQNIIYRKLDRLPTNVIRLVKTNPTVFEADKIFVKLNLLVPPSRKELLKQSENTIVDRLLS